MRVRAATAGLLLTAGLAFGPGFPLRGPLEPGSAPPPAAAPAPAATNYAALVVDTGTEVRTACVQFSEATITGRQLLERAAGIDPVFASIGGQGTAVCALCGVGCPAADCLTCAAPNYWAYFRAPAGSSGFTYSGVGAGATTVGNGDVEGWRWGTGAKPPFQSFASICPMAAPPTTLPPPTQPPTTASPPPSTGASPTSTGSRPTSTEPPGVVPTTGDTALAATSPLTTADEGSTTITRRAATRDTGQGDEVAAPPLSPRSGDGGDGWLGSALGFAVALAAVVGVTLRLRRTRRPTG